jgi:hypothetical protein
MVREADMEQEPTKQEQQMLNEIRNAAQRDLGRDGRVGLEVEKLVNTKYPKLASITINDDKVWVNPNTKD